MNRLNALILSATLCASARPCRADEPGGPAAPSGLDLAPRAAGPEATPEAPKRSEPPVPPIQYLEAGARLFNRGRYDLAPRYLAAANLYRDRLTESERTVLDVYREKLDQYLTDVRQAQASPPPSVPGDRDGLPLERGEDPQVVPASTTPRPTPGDPLDLPHGPGASVPFEVVPPAEAPAAPAEGQAADRPNGPLGYRGTESWRDTTDAKQKGRWLMRLAREQIHRKQFDAAERTVAEVRDMGVRWGFFDDNPDKITAKLAEARVEAAQEGKDGKADAMVSPAAIASTAASLFPDAEPGRDRRTARARLRVARAALAAGRLDEAEEIVSEVRTWGVRFGLFDDTPDKVSAKLAEYRRREAMRQTELSIKSYLSTGSGRVQMPIPGFPGSAETPQTLPPP